MSSLEKILCPKSIAIIGASRKEGSLGKMFLEAILRMTFKGTIYPINPKADYIKEIKCYPNIQSLPEKVDLAVILLSQNYVLDNLEELGQAGIDNVIVISAGFKEVGGEGIEREKQLIKTAKKYGMNLLGPNCMGVFNTEKSISFNGNFSPILPNTGHIAYVSQSGALGVAVMELAAKTDLGFSIFVSTGNKAVINDNDILEFLHKDNNTKVITLYLESIDQPDAFRKICSRVSALKPILAIKAGRTQSGFKAASSHTGALANPEYIIDGFLKQCGVIRKETLEDLFDAARALSLQPLPAGPRVAVITNAGGPAILASDALEKHGLKLAELDEKTIEKLKSFLPAEAATGNPIDMIASADHDIYYQALEAVQEDEGVDSILLIIVKPPVNTTPAKIAETLGSLIPNCGKTIIPVLMAQKDETAGMEIFQQLQLPVFSYPESAVKALSTMWEYHQIQQRFRKSEAVAINPGMKESVLTNAGPNNKQAPAADLLKLLEQYDITNAPYLVSDEVDKIIRFQKEMKSKIVLKIANEQIIHKTDIGLVKLGLDSDAAVREAFEDMLEKAESVLAPGVKPVFLAQKQLAAGIELVLGGKKDSMFGPVLMVGFGGIFIEVLKDVSFRIAPVNAFEAKEMIGELRSQPLLNGFRGNPAVDRDSFAYTIQRFSLLLAEHPEIVEMDLNPLIWQAERGSAAVVDVRATLA
jgi:acetyltransferase